MMYFSRVRIDTTSKRNISSYLEFLNSNYYAIHQLIWTLFPNRPDKSRMFLFRQEIEKEQIPDSFGGNGIPLFYVISSSRPVEKTDILKVETKEYSPKLCVGDKLAFSLRVNPVVSHKQEGKKNSKHSDILMDVKYHAQKESKDITPEEIKEKQQDAVIEWLSKKGETSGFNLCEKDRIEVTGYLQHILSKKGNHGIKYSTVDISGVLEITDVSSFISMLGNGLGSSKSFGCGMMMIRRV